MDKNLVVVESPAKARTIGQFLSSNFEVVASFGHVRDLPKKELGVDVKGDFTPKYVIPDKSRKIVNLLKSKIKGTNNFFIATDLDREGEAIGWHILQAIGLEGKTKPVIKRITFHEITKPAIEDALKNPRGINENLVEAQQARRVLDRLVGYKLSPFLWKKVYSGLSAGRVQSVAVRQIVDREREIENFLSQKYFEIVAILYKEEPTKNFKALLVAIDGKHFKKEELKSAKKVAEIIENLKKGEWQIQEIKREVDRRFPYPPFTTSTLQQEAYYQHHFTASKTMKIAQDLYEEGKITYMRTDSVKLSSLAINSIRKYIKEKIGEKYLPTTPRAYKTKSRLAQEAHEAIRPTFAQNEPEGQKFPTPHHKKLYDLIWRRAVACQMKEAILERGNVEIGAGPPRLAPGETGQYIFRAESLKTIFEGFWKIWKRGDEDKFLPPLSKGDKLNLSKLESLEKETKPPSRYSTASLIRALEDAGIGRPSTYAPIITTVMERGYVRLEQGRFYPQEVGTIVTDLLVKHFPEIVDIDFTAQMEDKLDEIANGKRDYLTVMKKFYPPFEKKLTIKEKEVKKSKEVEKKTDKICPKCQKPLVIRLSRFGHFLACSGFPDCRYTQQLINSTGMKCPDCKEGNVIERKTRKGKKFWGCSAYPKCKWGSWQDPTKPDANAKIKNIH